MGEIKFWEGNGCYQDYLGSVEVGDCKDGKHCVPWGETRVWNLKKEHHWIPNDEARSCTLIDVPAGTVIKIYDNPDGDTKDDWAEIIVHKTTTQEFCVWSFEIDFSDEWCTIRYHKKNGLDGKVSRIEVSVPSR